MNIKRGVLSINKLVVNEIWSVDGFVKSLLIKLEVLMDTVGIKFLFLRLRVSSLLYGFQCVVHSTIRTRSQVRYWYLDTREWITCVRGKCSLDFYRGRGKSIETYDKLNPWLYATTTITILFIVEKTMNTRFTKCP